jgi:hypothetical protein
MCCSLLPAHLAAVAFLAAKVAGCQTVGALGWAVTLVAVAVLA